MIYRCKVEDCEATVKARGVCKRHYRLWSEGEDIAVDSPTRKGKPISVNQRIPESVWLGLPPTVHADRRKDGERCGGKFVPVIVDGMRWRRCLSCGIGGEPVPLDKRTTVQ